MPRSRGPVVDFARTLARKLTMLSLPPSRLLGVLTAALILPAALFAEKPFAFTDTPGQLPKTAVPRHYTLRIQPDLDQRTTTGTATIELEVLQAVHELVLNSNELVIDSAVLADDRAAPRALVPRLDPVKQTLTLPVELPAGPHTLLLAYHGRIGTQAEGFFIDKYPTPAGDKLMLGTQMEPTDARRVFPCWDEPVYRATYDITLVVPEKLMAVSNMPIVRETPLGHGFKEVAFARTPAMASYLVALYAGEFETVEGEQDGVKLRIITNEGKRATATYALESTKRILAYYNEYFGLRYPLPKLDQVAVPNAFATFGAMENWGCITYIDTAILFNPTGSSQATRERVFAVIAHEMAHQWFGNLVTMAWWDNLWLNEGFASWMGTKCTDALNPEWQAWLRANTQKNNAMALDARKTTHPIQQPVANESQATDAFDTISYLKGQAFLRMLETYLGADTFRAGIRRYVEQNKLSSTTTADLWAALGEASGKPVVALAAGWTERPGFPVVTLTTTGTGDDRRLVLAQTRFTYDHQPVEPLLWKIPVTLANSATLATPAVFLLNSATDTTLVPAGGGTVKANAGDSGYYRVLYDYPLADALRRAIPTLPVADQLNLLADTDAFVEAGLLSEPDYLELVEQLHDSRSLPVWNQIIDSLDSVDLLQRGQPGRRAFQAWAVSQLAPQLARLGWEPAPGESPLDGTLRAELVGTLGFYGDRVTIAECYRRFENFQKEPGSLPGDLRGPVLAVVGRYATRQVYDQLHALARNALTTEDKRRAYAAMQSAVDPVLAAETLKLSLGTEMPASEAARNVSRVAFSSEQTALAWDFARDHLPALLETMPFFGRNQYLPRITTAFTDAARADELLACVRAHLTADALTETEKAADLIRHNAAVKQRELPKIDAWVKTRVKLPE
jgi:aminopeptidase N